LTVLDEALQIVQRTGERRFAAELYRHKGELLAAGRERDHGTHTKYSRKCMYGHNGGASALV